MIPGKSGYRDAAGKKNIPPGRNSVGTTGCLDPVHYQQLKGSGLTPDTIRRAQFYTGRDTGRLRLMWRGIPATAPALILPGFDRHGRRTGYEVARMIPPHRWRDGTEAKYLMAQG